MELAQIVKTIVQQEDVLELHYGVITDHKGTAPKSVSLTLSGSTTVLTGIRYLHSYAPQVGHTVLVLSTKKDIVVLGNLED